NRMSADLFLSIHANASASAGARGIETYFLNFANNQSAAAVAARENAESAQAMGALPDFVKAIALNNKLDESKDFANQVQRAMIEKLRGINRPIRDLGVKQAPFVVLIGAAMPSVLAEVSFVTNPQEARLLRGNAYRQRIGEAPRAAIRKDEAWLRGGRAVARKEIARVRLRGTGAGPPLGGPGSEPEHHGGEKQTGQDRRKRERAGQPQRADDDIRNPRRILWRLDDP